MRNLKRLLVGLLAVSCAAVLVACNEDDTTPTNGNLPLTNGDTTLIMLYKPIAASTSLEYSGDTLRLTLLNFNDSVMTVVGDSGVNAGDYTYIVTLKDTSAYAWNDGTKDSIAIAWKITPKLLGEPVATGITSFRYDGNPKTLSLVNFDSAIMTISGNVETEVGSYECVVGLKDVNNYVWINGTTADVRISWSIAPEGSRSSVEIPSVIHSFHNDNPSGDMAWFWDLAYDPQLMEVIGEPQPPYADGVYTFSVALKDKLNYEWADGTDTALTVKLTLHPSLKPGEYKLSRVEHNDSIYHQSSDIRTEHIPYLPELYASFTELEKHIFYVQGGWIMPDENKMEAGVLYYLDYTLSGASFTYNSDKVNVYNDKYLVEFKDMFENLYYTNEELVYTTRTDGGYLTKFVFTRKNP